MSSGCVLCVPSLTASPPAGTPNANRTLWEVALRALFFSGSLLKIGFTPTKTCRRPVPHNLRGGAYTPFGGGVRQAWQGRVARDPPICPRPTMPPPRRAWLPRPTPKPLGVDTAPAPRDCVGRLPSRAADMRSDGTCRGPLKFPAIGSQMMQAFRTERALSEMRLAGQRTPVGSSAYGPTKASPPLPFGHRARDRAYENPKWHFDTPSL